MGSLLCKDIYHLTPLWRLFTWVLLELLKYIFKGSLMRPLLLQKLCLLPKGFGDSKFTWLILWVGLTPRSILCRGCACAESWRDWVTSMIVYWPQGLSLSMVPFHLHDALPLLLCFHPISGHIGDGPRGLASLPRCICLHLLRGHCMDRPLYFLTGRGGGWAVCYGRLWT